MLRHPSQRLAHIAGLVYVISLTSCAFVGKQGRPDAAATPPPVARGGADVPPASPTLLPAIRQADSGELLISWSLGSAAGEPAGPLQSELSLSSATRGCERPLVTYTTSAQSLRLAKELPGGRFLLCLTTIGAQGRRTSATNQGQVTIDQPVTLEYLAFRGDAAESRTLVLGRVIADEAVGETVVAAPRADRRIAGRASMQLGAQAEPHIAFVTMADGPNVETSLALTMSRPAVQGFQEQTVLLARRPAHINLAGIVALSPSGASYLTQLGKGGADEGSDLIYTSTQAGNVGNATIAIDRAVGAASFQDVGMTYDDGGRLHIAYVQDGRLMTRQRDLSSWSAPQRVETPGCARVDLVATAAGGPRIAMAYACDRSDGDAGGCSVGLASRASDAEADQPWHADTAMPVGATACIPFSSHRPAVAVDDAGRAHLLARQATEQGYQIVYAAEAKPGSGVSALTPIGLPDALTGYPQLAVDATGGIHAAYLSRQGLVRVLIDGEDGIRLKPIAGAGAAGIGIPLELADLVAVGGHGRSQVPFGNWVR